MKFLVKKNLDYTVLLNNLLIAVAGTLFMYLLLDMFLHYFVIGMDIQSIASTLYGNEEAYIESILLDTLLLQVHIDLFMSIVTLMIISAMYIRFFNNHKSTKILVHILLLSGIIAPLGLLVAYFTSVFFVYVWLGSFIIEHILGMFMSIVIIKRLLFK